MKITFLLPPLTLTGGVKVVALYAQHLVNSGHEVSVVAPPPALPGRKTQFKNLILFGNRRGRKASPSHIQKLGIKHSILDKARPITNSDVPDADIVIATWWETAEWMMNLSPAKGKKVHFMQGYEVFHEQTAERVHAVHRLPVSRIVISRWLQQMLRTNDGVEAEFLVENGIDDQYFSADHGRIKPHKPTVGLLLSQGVKVKGMTTALAVLRKVQREYPDVRVLSFAGHHVADALDLPPGVIPEIDPPQARIREIYESCSVWLSCSTNEGFNLTVVEALATGTPVVTTRVGWPSNGIHDGVNGFVCDVDDVENITRRTCEVLAADTTQWGSMSTSAKESVSGLRLDRAAADFERALLAVAKG